jgi:hypothetical protein
MPVMITADQPGMTEDMYDGMAAALLPLLAQRPGFIAHAAWPVAGGWQVMEIWESEADHDSWAKDVVLPAMPEGIDPPELTVQPLRNVLTAQWAASTNSPQGTGDDSRQA